VISCVKPGSTVVEQNVGLFFTLCFFINVDCLLYVLRMALKGFSVSVFVRY